MSTQDAAIELLARIQTARPGTVPTVVAALTPSSSDNVYSVDGPGIPGTSSYADEAIYKINALEWLEIKLDSLSSARGSDDVAWYSVTSLINSGGNWARNVSGTNTIATGSTTINTGSTP